MPLLAVLFEQPDQLGLQGKLDFIQLCLCLYRYFAFIVIGKVELFLELWKLSDLSADI